MPLDALAYLSYAHIYSPYKPPYLTTHPLSTLPPPSKSNSSNSRIATINSLKQAPISNSLDKHQ